LGSAKASPKMLTTTSTEAPIATWPEKKRPVQTSSMKGTPKRKASELMPSCSSGRSLGTLPGAAGH
jgi:hypothetical protein